MTRSTITTHTAAELEARLGLDATTQAGIEEALIWRSASRTDVGRVRHVNEDDFLDLAEQQLWVVADGMAGQGRGDYASKAVVTHLKTFTRDTSLAANLNDLRDKLFAVNEQCRSAFRQKRPGTTVAAMLAHAGYGFFLWAGDSRIYRLREKTLKQLTEDHTLESRHKQGRQTLHEQTQHQAAHILTRAIGAHRTLRLDLDYASIGPGDRYLLCSDGLYNPVHTSEICALLGEGSPADACEALIARALERGARDNITVIVVEAASPA
ncbi:MAG: protein phosphatase 2C domain-containing protein [Pseudomonadota bacterium]